MEVQTQFIVTYIVTGVLSSLVAAGVFLGFLRAIRPRITICDGIARSEIREEERGSHSIKVVNRSWFRLIDIDVRLDLIRRHASPPEGHPLLTVTNVPLVSSHMFDLAPCHPLWRDQEAKYAVRFAVKGNLEDYWPEDERTNRLQDFLLFRVAATHSLSGFRRVVEKRFTRGAVQDGVFHFGKSCEIGK